MLQYLKKMAEVETFGVQHLFFASSQGLHDSTLLGQCALPGEAEEAPSSYAPSFCHHAWLELYMILPDQGLPQGSLSESQVETEEVLFSVDESFGYDHVTPCHKHLWVRINYNVQPPQRFSGHDLPWN
ncbi:hypothetical protein GN956_G25947 [Arapaima gigas]